MRNKLWIGCCLFCALLCSTGRCEAKSQGKTEAGTLQSLSGLYDTPEEIPKPVSEWQGERRYLPVSYEVEPVPVTGRSGEVEGDIWYRGVGRQDGIPAEGELEIDDRAGKSRVTAVLPLLKVEYENERWEDSLCFTATFHRYGADSYELGGRRIGGGGTPPDPEQLTACGKELLALAGLPAGDCIVEHCEWAGEPYTDGEGELCRDVKVTGKRRVFDCRAIYRGRAELPDCVRYRLRAVYEEAPEETGQPPEEETVCTEAPGAKAGVEEAQPGLWERVLRVVKLCLEVTFGLAAFLLALLGFRLLVQAAKKLDERRKEEDER